MATKLKVVVLISGRGSNFKNLLNQQGNYQIIGLVSDQPKAPGIEFAKEQSLPITIIERERCPSKLHFNLELVTAINALAPDIIALAGFMRILSREFINQFPGRIINIHPSLLPAFPGLNTHQAAIDAKAVQHGCTVHFVDYGVDTGPIIAQAPCIVLDSDSAESLGKRVLDLEHKIYPWCISGIAEGKINLHNEQVVISPDLIQDAEAQGFLIY